MPITTTTLNSFPYHRQDYGTMCGPACAQMVLNYLQKKAANQFATQLPNQEELKTDADKLPTATKEPWNRYVSDAWATRPDELKQALFLRQAAFNVFFEAYYNGNAKDGMKDGKSFLGYLSQLRKWINDTKSPGYPIVPIQGAFYYKQQLDKVVEAHGYTSLVKYDAKSNYDAHWVVLFKHDKEGFLGNDPYFPLTNGADRHTHSDTCKTVLIHLNGKDSDIYDYNFPAINRTAVRWYSVPSGNPGGRIGGPLLSEPSPIQPPLLPPPPLPMVTYDEPNKAFDETNVRQQMDSFGLFTNRPCSSYLSGTIFGKPRLVRRLDVIRRDYYIVPMFKPDGNSSALVRVDASTGIYLDSLYYSENPFIFDKSQLQQMWMQSIIQQITQWNSNWVKPFTTQINESATEMVWLPCQESCSAFFPFYVIKVPNEKNWTERFLVRVDWRIFTKLTY